MESNQYNHEFEIQLSDEILHIKYSRNGKCFVYLTEYFPNKFMLVAFDIKTLSEKCRIHLNNESKDYVCFEDKGVNYLLVSFDDGLYLWNIDTGESVGHLGLNVKASLVTGLEDFSLSTRGNYVGYTALDKTLTQSNKTFMRLYDLHTGGKIHEKKYRHANDSAICFSPDNQHVLFILDKGDQMIFHLYKFDAKNRLYFVEKVKNIVEIGTSLEPIKAQFHPNGEKVFFTRGKKILLFDMASKKIEQCLDFVTTKIHFEFNADGSLFMIDTDLGVALFDSITGELVRDISEDFYSGNDEYLITASISPISNHILLTYSGGKVKSVDLDVHVKDELFELDDDKLEIKFRPYTETKQIRTFQWIVLIILIGALIYLSLEVL